LLRRIRRRMAAAGIQRIADYIATLRQDTRELELLAKDFLIQVTSFFRDPAAFEGLAKTILPGLVVRAEDQPIRVWVPGCSTGEEAYSLAIMFIEEFAAQKRRQISDLCLRHQRGGPRLRARGRLSRIDQGRRLGGAAAAILYARGTRLPGFTPAARRHRIHGSRSARRSAIFASRSDFLPQPIDLFAAGRTTEGFVTLPLRSERDRFSVSRHLRDDRPARWTFRADLEYAAGLPPQRLGQGTSEGTRA